MRLEDPSPSSSTLPRRGPPPRSQRIPTADDLGLLFAGLLEGRYQQRHEALEQRRAHVVVDQVLDQLDGWGRQGRWRGPPLHCPPSPSQGSSTPSPPTLYRPFLAPLTGQHCARRGESWAGDPSVLPFWSSWLKGRGRRRPRPPGTHRASQSRRKKVGGLEAEKSWRYHRGRAAKGL